MENSFSKNAKISQNRNKSDTYELSTNSKIIPHDDIEEGNNTIHSNESLSNIIDVINNI